MNSTFRHGSLFSGIGGFDLAAEWMGWENVFHCEWEEFPQRVLKHYWPNSISYGDIKKTDFTIHRGRIDILTGGFPCQPYSQAGKRLGKEDDRHLWPEMLRAIREIKPTYVVGENVYGLINWNGGLVFEEVQADLETIGYTVQPVILPACGVNAPHKRDRIWFIAHSGLQRQTERQEQSMGSNKLCPKRTTSNSGVKRCGQGSDNRKERHIQNNVDGDAEENKPTRDRWECWACEVSEVITNTSDQGLQGSKEQGGTSKCESERNKQSSGFLQPNWKEFPTQPPICSRDDGIQPKLVGITVSKHRKESIKAYGNAVVPQVVFEIFKVIQQIDDL